MFSKPPEYKRCDSGLTLVEIMVAVALLLVIMGGLMAMFDQTQRAFVTGLRQVDVLEGGRAAVELVSRDLERMAAGGREQDTNFFVEVDHWFGDVKERSKLRSSSGDSFQTNVLQMMFFLSRQSGWKGIGYRVVDLMRQTPPTQFGNTNGSFALLGTLYRFETNSVDLHGTNFLSDFLDKTSTYRQITNGTLSRVIDGIVRFQVVAYDELGRRMDSSTNVLDNPEIWDEGSRSSDTGPAYSYRARKIPAFVEVEIGVLEPQALVRARALSTASSVYPSNLQEFLAENSGKIHLFRQRVPIRAAGNFAN